MDEAQIRWLLKALREAAGEIEEYLYRLDGGEATAASDQDGPTLIEIAARLRDNEEQVLGWLDLIATSRRYSPPLPYTNIDLLPFDRDYRRLSLRKVLRQFLALRQQTIRLLWLLEPRDWLRSGEHPYRGTLSIGEIVRDLNWHDLSCLWEIRRLLGDPDRVEIDT
jgi:hypothetical protein